MTNILLKYLHYIDKKTPRLWCQFSFMSTRHGLQTFKEQLWLWIRNLYTIRSCLSYTSLISTTKKSATYFSKLSDALKTSWQNDNGPCLSGYVTKSNSRAKKFPAKHSAGRTEGDRGKGWETTARTGLAWPLASPRGQQKIERDERSCQETKNYLADDHWDKINIIIMINNVNNCLFYRTIFTTS